MLKNILKPKKTTVKKLKKDEAESTSSVNLAEVTEEGGENEETKKSSSGIVPKKLKTTVKTDKAKPVSKSSTIKKTGKKTMVDTMTKFINNYGETPHLQAIEDSYLKYLEA